MSFSCYLIGADTLLLECGRLLLSKGHTIAGVVTGAAKVRQWAEENGLEAIPLDSEFKGVLADNPYDYLFAITHLALLPDDVLQTPGKAAINFHDGPLPRYAGLNAPAWALMNGEENYGITWHVMTVGADEGDILEQRTFELAANETSLTLNTRNFQVAIESFAELVDKLNAGSETRTKQDASQRSLYMRHQRPENLAFLDFARPASELEALIRGLDFGDYDNPLYSAKLRVGTDVYRVVRAEAVAETAGAGPGEVEPSEAGPVIGTADGGLLVAELQTLAGGEVDLSVLVPGTKLEGPSAGLRDTLATSEQGLVRAERFFQRRLESVAPAELSLARPGAQAGDFVEERVSYPASGFGDPKAAALAALCLYLGRTSGKYEFSVAYSGARQGEIASALPGLTVAHVPMSFTWSGDQSIAAVVDAVTAELAQLSAKGTYFKDLIGRQSALRGRPHLADGAVSPVAVSVGASSQAAPPGTLLQVCLEPESMLVRCARDAFADPARLAAQLGVALRSAFADPQAACRDVALLSEEEQQRVLQQWNDTAVPTDGEACVHRLFEAQAKKEPNRTAVECNGEKLSYAELDQRANALALDLSRRGVKPDSLVAVMVQRSADMLVAVLGVLKAGGAYVPVDPSYPDERIAYMLEDSGVQWVVKNAASSVALPSGVEGVAVEEASRPATTDTVDSGVTPANLSYVIYTSGSTGRPKGVMVEHRNVHNFFLGMDPVIAQGDGRVWLSVTSLSFDISVLELFWTLARGFSIVLHRDDAKAATDAGAPLEPGRPIDFSLFLWGADDKVSDNKYELMLHAGRFGDEHGFSAVWTPERHFHAFGGPYPNPSVTSAALAAVTSKLQIRAGSCVVPLHHPVRVAEEWAVVDNISGGRVGISFAAGWQPDDFLLQPDNYKENKRIMVDYIDQVRRLWRGETLQFKNGMGNDVSVLTQPRPVQDELPYWVTTAGNPQTFELAGKSGANLLTHLLGQSFEELQGKLKVYRQARADAGLDPQTGIVSLMLHTYVGESNEVVKERVREPMKEYLRSSVNLIKGFAWAFPAFKKPKKGGGEELDVAGLSDEDLDTILEFAFERYYESSGLFGTPEKCIETVRQARAIGVDDIACLIDFGVPTVQVKEGLTHLGRLRSLVQEQLAASSAAAGAESGDYSLATLAKTREVTHMQCTPSLMRMALQDPETKQALFGIPHLFVGGEAMPLKLAQELAARPTGDLTNMYGPTETTVWSSVHRVEANPTDVAIGRPIANTALYVLDCEGKPVPLGVPGELHIGGSSVVRGYYNRPELTQERFLPDPFKGGDARMYRTGDLVRYRDDGVLEFLGRTDHQVKIRGHRIELGEIETLLTQPTDVAEGVVVARDDNAGGLRLVAYYTGSADADTLRSRLRERLPDFMVPAVFCQLRQMPHTPNGKIDRKALPEPEQGRAASSGAPVAVEGGAEAEVAQMWKDVLGIDEVGATDNFFDLGGHSLLVVRLHQMLKGAFGAKVPMTSIYRFPTIRGFVESLNDGDSSKAAEQAKDRGAMRRAQLSRRRRAR